MRIGGFGILNREKLNGLSERGGWQGRERREVRRERGKKDEEKKREDHEILL